MSRLDWKRLRRFAVYCTFAGAVAAGTVLYMKGGVDGVILSAEGYVTRDHLNIAPAFEGRVIEVFVRPGDHVVKGQKIAIVESVGIRRTLSELAVEKARLVNRIAQLRAQSLVASQTLPAAQESAHETAAYLNTLREAKAAGLILNKSLQQMTAASLDASERVAKLRADQDALAAELAANEAALTEVASAYNHLNGAYAEGVLYAPATGDVGSEVASVGQVLNSGELGVTRIYTGQAYVLSYLPDAYLFELSEGESVGVKVRRDMFNGTIDRLFPITATVPSDFQLPNQVRERGRLMRIALQDAPTLPVNQRVRVTTCLADDCRTSAAQLVYDRSRIALEQFVGTAYSSLHNDAVAFAALFRNIIPSATAAAH